MKKIQLFVIAFCISLSSVYSQESSENSESNDSSKSPLINILLIESTKFIVDFKYIDPEKGLFGIDYDLILSSKRIKTTSSDFNLKSRGFLTLSENSTNSLNNIKNTLNYTIVPGFSEKKNVTNSKYRNVEDAIGRGREISAYETKNFYPWFDFHTNHETTQDFKDYNFTAGASIIIDTPLIGSIIDIPFQLFRTSNLQGFNKLELTGSVDYVWGLENTLLISDSVTISSINRASLGGFYETEIFDNIRFVCNFEAHLLFDAPETIKQISKDKNYFLQLIFDIPIDKNRDKSNKYISIKYIDGALPPNFNNGHVLGAGFFMTL